MLQPELRSYLSRRTGLSWPSAVGDRMLLTRDALEALPKSAREAIGTLPWLLPLSATCVVAQPVDVDLSLFAFRVAAPEPGLLPQSLSPSQQVPSVEPVAVSTLPRTAGSRARSEIFSAITSLVRIRK